MMVEIPDDVAKQMGEWLRHGAQKIGRKALDEWADLLDPKPQTLRDKVATVIAEGVHPTQDADAVLAVVKADLDALPVEVVGGVGMVRDAEIDALFGDTVDSGRDL